MRLFLNSNLFKSNYLQSHNHQQSNPMSSPSCLICDQPSTRVCVHPDCQKIPFICAGLCKHQQNSALIVHTHSSKNMFVPYRQLSKKITEMKEERYLENYIKLVRSKVQLVIDDLYHMLYRFEALLAGKECQLKKEFEESIQNINNREKNHLLTGKQIFNLLDCENIFDNNNPQQEKINIIKKEMSQAIAKIESLNLIEVLSPKFIDEFLKNPQQYSTSESVSIKPVDRSQQVELSELPRKSEGFVKDKDPQISRSNAAQLFKKGQSCYQNEEYYNAMRHFTHAIRENKHEPEFFFCRAQSLQKKNYPLQRPLRDYTQAIQLDPTCAKYYFHRCRLLFKIGRLGAALSDIDKAIEIDRNDDRFFYERGCLVKIIGDFKCIEDCERAVDINGRQSQYYQQMAMSHMKLNNYTKALESINEAIRINPNELYIKNRTDITRQLESVHIVIESEESK